MSLLFHKNFSDALTGANGFDSVGAGNGTIAHSAGAGLNGTSGGVTCTRTADSPNLFGSVTQDFTGKSILRTAWYTDLASLTIGTDNHLTRLFRFSTTTTLALIVEIIRLSGVLNIRHMIYRDTGGQSSNTVVLGTPDWIELRLERASDGSTSDGNSQLYCGGGSYAPLGELVSNLTGHLNYTRFERNTFMMGMGSGGTSVGGSLLFDEWTMRDDDTPILFGVSESVISRGMKYVLNRRRRKSYCW